VSAGPAVVTLTAAGAIDATYRVPLVRPGSFTRASAYSREMSGKGVNVSAALALADRTTTAVVVIGHDDLDFAERSAHAALLRPVTVPGATRVNTSIIDDAGLTTKVNAPSDPLEIAVWDDVVAVTLAEVDRLGAGWLVVSGSIPLLAGTTETADLTTLLDGARQRGARVAIDGSGPALARSVQGAIRPSLIKPNTGELAELTGRSLRTHGEVADAARELVDRGVTAVYASLGADGVVVVTARAVIHAKAGAARLANTAGAGDASLAGFLVGLGGESLDETEALAAAASAAASWGAHAVAQESTILPHLRGLPVAAVAVDPDPGIVLSEPALVD